ncbi:MAG: hypothetical protein WBO28_05255 [Flavobacteriales bacterium]
MEANEDAKTPTEQLADRLRRRLLEEGLLKEDRMDAILPKIKSGKIKPEDWKMAIELSLKPKKP